MATVNQGWAFVSGSSLTAGGSSREIQWNNSGFLEGDPKLKWQTTEVLAVTGTIETIGDISASINISASGFYGDGSNLTNVTASATEVADGPEMSIQFRKDDPISGEISGSANLMWITSSTDYLQVTGNIHAKGYLYLGSAGTAYIINNADTDTQIKLGGGGVPGIDGMTFTVGGKDLLVLDENSDDRVILGALPSDRVFTSGSFTASVGAEIIGDLTVCQGTASISDLSGCSPIAVHSPMSSSYNISASAFYGSGINLEGVVMAGAKDGGIFTEVDASNAYSTSSLNVGGTTAPVHELVVSGTLSASTHVSASAFYTAGDIFLGDNQTIYFEDDEGTYIESDTADRLRFVVGGNQMLLLDEDENRVNIGYGNDLAVGLGNNTSPDASLHVSGTTEQLFLVEGSPWGNVLSVSGSGLVAITGSLETIGDISASTDISASAYYVGPDGRGTFYDTGTDTCLLAMSTALHINADGGSVVLQGPAGPDINQSGILSSSMPISSSGFYGSSLKCDEKLTLSSSNNIGIDADSGIVAFADGGSAKLLLYMNNSAAPAIFDSVGGNIGLSPNSAGGGGFVGVTGSLSASINISASAFYGDGANLTNVSLAVAGVDTNVQFNQHGELAANAGLAYDGTGSLALSASAWGAENIVYKGFLPGTASYGGRLTIDGPSSSLPAYLGTSNVYLSHSEMGAMNFNYLETVNNAGPLLLSSSGDIELTNGTSDTGNFISLDTNMVDYTLNTASLGEEDLQYAWSINSAHTGEEEESAWVKLDLDGGEFVVGGADNVQLSAMSGLQVEGSPAVFLSTANFPSDVTSSAVILSTTDPMVGPGLWISSSSPALPGPPGAENYAGIWLGSGSLPPGDSFTGAALSLNNFGGDAGGETLLMLRSRAGHLLLQSDGASADTTVKATDGEVILSASEGVISHTPHSFSKLATFNAGFNVNNAAGTFNDSLNAWGNTTIGEFHSNTLEVNASASFNNMGNINSSASNIIWQIHSGSNATGSGPGQNGPLLFFTSGAVAGNRDYLKFHTNTDANPGVVLANHVYMNNVGDGEEQPAQFLSFYVSSSNNGYVTRTTGQQVFNQAVSSSTSTGLSASNGTLSVQIPETKTGGIALSSSTADLAGGLFLSGSDLPAGAFDHGSWYNSTLIFTDVNDTAHNGMKYITLASVVDKIAGANLTATNGVLAASGGGGGGGGGIFTELDASHAYSTSSVNIGGTATPDHQVVVSGSLSASVNISASSFASWGGADSTGLEVYSGAGVLNTTYGMNAITNKIGDFTIQATQTGGSINIDSSDTDGYMSLNLKNNGGNYGGFGSGSINDQASLQIWSPGNHGAIEFKASAGGGKSTDMLVLKTAAGDIAHISGSEEASGGGLLRVSGDTSEDILFVTGSGHVGIGTDTPSRTLHVSGTVNDASLLVASDSKAIEFTPGAGPAISFGTPADTDYYMKVGAFGGFNQIYLNNAATDFQISGSSGGIGYYFDQSESRVGIGTTTPTAQLAVGGALHVTGSIMPGDDNTHDLGSSAMRWANVYTGDLHLANDRGNWTVVEESDYLTIRNNKTGKRFKLLMEEID